MRNGIGRRPGTPPKLDGGSQRLDLRQVSFEGDISEYDGTLSFYLPVTFDPDAVFGTNVTSDSNGDWLNVYANYDLEKGGPEQSLTVVLVCGDGNEFEFSYPLTASDREQLREKMEGYCQSQAGMSLDNYRQELCSEEVVHGTGASDVAGGSRPRWAAPAFLPVVAPVPPRVALLMAGWHPSPSPPSAEAC